MAVILADILCMFAIYLMCSATEGLVTTIDVRVEGRTVLKSGVRQYSVYGKFTQPFTVRCVLNSAAQPNKVRILKNLNTVEELTTSLIRRGLTTTWNITIPFKRRTDDTLDKYTCRALFIFTCPSVVNGSQCHSVSESDVDVRVEMTPSMALSVGSSVYLGEQMSIKCIARYRNEEANICFVENGIPVPPTHIFVSNAQNNLTCTWMTHLDGVYRECHTTHLKLLIFSELELSLTPSNFSSNFPTIQFKCTSVPPRLMQWTIITASGAILDFNSLDDIIKVSMNVTIKQRPGETILDISEASPSSNRIETVMCSSYDTTSRVIVTSHRMVIDEDRDRDIVPASTPQTNPTHRHRRTTAECNPNLKTVPQHVVAIESYFDDETRVQQFQSHKDTTYVILSVVVIATLACIICVLIVYVVMLYRRISKPVAIDVLSTPHDAGEEPGRETTLFHDNPVYVSYSDSEGTIDQAGSPQSDSYTYMNI